jgi:hypothetical protein
VQMWVEPQVGGHSLHRRDAARPGAALALSQRTARVEPLQRVLEDADERAEQGAVLGEGEPPGEGEREHPLAQRGLLGQDALHEVGGRGVHPSAQAGGAEASSLAAERHDPALAAGRAAEPGKASPAEQPAAAIRLEFLARVLGEPRRERTVADRAVEGLEVVAHDLVERGGVGAVALVGANAGGRGGGGHGRPPGRAACPAWRGCSGGHRCRSHLANPLRCGCFAPAPAGVEDTPAAKLSRWAASTTLDASAVRRSQAVAVAQDAR